MGTEIGMSEVLEGEVVETHRTRERNTIRSVGGVEVLPPDVETKVVALRGLPVESQASAVTAMLAHSKAGLLTAIAAQDLPTIVEWKAKAGAIQEMAKQLQLGREMQLEAAEFVRRAERGVAVAIRGGQSRGEIETPLEAKSRAGRKRQHVVNDMLLDKPKPTDFGSPSDLSGTGVYPGSYDLADGVSNEMFEQALAEARAEANMSRTNVARKAGTWPHKKDAAANDSDVRKTARARKTVELLAITLGNLALGVAEVDPIEVDRDQLQGEIDSIDQSLGEIRGFIRKVNKQ